LIPVVLSFLNPPKEKHTRYLENPRLNRWLDRLERWSLNHRKLIYVITILIVIASIAGMFRLRSEGFIVDDLPKTDKIYKDLKFFETHFKGIMPLEIVIDTKKRYGVSRNLNNLIKIDSFSQFLASIPNIGKPLSIAEGLRFAKQAFFEGDSLSYTMPAEYDLPALSQYLSMRTDTASSKNSFARIISTFMDTARQQARITVNMADVGSYELPKLLDTIRKKSDHFFDTSN
jgi:predicted RND superfamily exporter protein